jgi:N-dimethylarginine dimethylaminohydrolase
VGSSGLHQLMASPEHFRVDYAINPWMRPDVTVDLPRARSQWTALRTTLEGLGARVEVLPGRAGASDMVYAMNLGLVDAGTTAGGRPRVVLSHMRHPQRRMETRDAAAWFSAAGYEVLTLGADGVGPHLEAGDAFPYADALVVAVGPRTGEEALRPLAAALDVRVRGLRLVHPALYHLDLAFCPLDASSALVAPAAFDAASSAALLDLVPDPVLLDVEEAFRFVANSVVVDRTVVMPACPERVRRELKRRGFEVLIVALDELHKGGGSARCLTNPLDWHLDAARLPGGAVVLPAAEAAAA